MKTRYFYALSALAIVAMVLVACAPPATPAPTAAPQAVTRTVVIGYTASQTGSLNEASIRQNDGLQLWMKQLNDAGGIKLSDGTVLKFEAKFYDDESNKERVQELYTRLATEDKADFLISPYSSGLADAAPVIAEQYGRIMITTGAAANETYQKGYKLVFQAYTPASAYLTSSVDLLGHLDPNLKKIAFVHENDKFSTSVVGAANAYAESKGYEIVLLEGYDSGTTDFAPFINKIQQAQPEALLGGGHLQDGSTFARQLYEKQVPIKYVALLVAPPEPSFAELGDAALGVVGPSQWEPQAKYTPDFGTTGDQFFKDYMAAYGKEPSYHSAGGYVAGLLLERAIRSADSTDTEKVKAALDAMDVITFFGHMKFDTTAESHGLQIGHQMVNIQWQKDASGNLVKQVVFPLEGKTAEALFPIR